MNVTLKIIIEKIKKYKLILLPLIPLSLLIMLVIFLLSPQNPPPSSTSPTSTKTPQTSASYDEGAQNIQREEKLSDGSSKTTIDSTNKDRPDIVITAPDGSILFERSVIGPYAQESLPNNLQQYGQPDQTFMGSNFYGQQAQTYLYASQGVAIIANPQTDQVFEKQFFPQMSISDYLKKYGDDISNK